MNLHLLHLGPAQTLGWTLIHFLWQGAAIAAVSKLVLGALKTRSAQARYLASCCGLGALLLCPLTTFLILPPPVLAPVAHAAVGPGTPAGQEQRPIGSGLVVRVASRPTGALATIPEWVDARLPWVLLMWTAGVLTLSIRLATGWWRVRRLASAGLRLVEADWQDRLSRAAERLAIKRPVQLARSAFVQVPTVLGWLRPVVLLPVSSLTGLGPAELEAILAHELAHVRRHDYLVNLLQSVVETLLFYHPAVWWISGQMRIEREHACDDLVVAAYGNPVSYARALANLEEHRFASGRFALSAAGGSLLHRVRRLVGKPVESRTSAAWIFGMTVPLAFACWLLGVPNAPAAAAVAAADPRPATPQLSATAAQRLAQSAGEPVGLDKPDATPVSPGAVTSSSPPVIRVDIKFAAVEEAALKEFGLGSAGANRPRVDGTPVQIQITNRNGVISQPARDAKGNVAGNLFDNPGLRNLEQVTPGLAQAISAERYRTLIRQLERRLGSDVLAAPRITTLSGRQARIEVIDIKQIVTGVSISTDSQNHTAASFNSGALPTGPAVDLVPEVLADGKMIQLLVIPSWTEFLGYDDPGGPFIAAGEFQGDKLQPLEVQRPLPHFQARQTLAMITVRDGETIVISGFGASPAGSQTPKEGKSSSAGLASKRQLVVFVTPVLVDSAGNRFNP